MWVAAGPPYIYGQVAQLNAAEQCFDVVIWGAPGRSVGRIQALDGVFLAMNRRVVETVRFDDRTFQGFHLYDLDFTFRAYLAGFRLAVCTDFGFVHASHGRFDEEWHRQAQLFHDKHKFRLSAGERRRFVVTQVRVRTPQEVLEVMTPAHWEGSSMSEVYEHGPDPRTPQT
jgi:GT2 family glycosyltransferase